METVTDFIFLGPKITVDGDCSHSIKRWLLLGRKSMINLDSILKSRDITLPTQSTQRLSTQGLSTQSCGFSCSHVWMWEFGHKESWAPNNWCFWTVMLEKTLESSLDCKEIQPVHPKGDQSWIYIGRTNVEAETSTLWNFNILATWCEDLTHWTRSWCWERLKAEGEGDDRRWDGWMASPTWWTRVWAGSGNCWWTGRPGMLHPWGCKELEVTEWLNWTVL